MDHAQHNFIVNFIWSIAADVLRDIYIRGKYRDVILPMTVIRRLDRLLEPTKDHVLKMKKRLDEAGIVTQDAALCQASGHAFYNTSQFTLKMLLDNPKQLRANFTNYLDGFSENVCEIIDKFDFRNQLKKLDDADALGHLIGKFIDPNINLSPKPVLDGQGNVKLPGLDNHAMGTIFEELIRRFNEENNEEAGEHFTPRDVIKLMANLIFLPIANQIESSTYLVYDGACGTGGMLTVAEETLASLAAKRGKDVSIHLFGQEINPETFAISKADLLLKGEGGEAENMKYGSTLSADAFPAREFDFMLSNPPYGKSWKTDMERMGGKKDISDPRFIVEHAGDPEFKMITRADDGQLMFLVNKLQKLKHNSTRGSRIAEVHNGSSLFTGDAGSGESNIRRWIIENDWLEAIVALPLNMFYNTDIATYIWIISNRKAKHRKGKIQLIDATQWFQPLRRNLGKKNCELSTEHIQRICDTFLAFEENDHSKIFPNKAFGYWKVTVERPLRLRVELADSARQHFQHVCKQAKEGPLVNVVDRVTHTLGPGPHLDFNTFLAAVEGDADAHNVKLTAKRKKLLQTELAIKDENAQPVVKKLHKPGKAEADSIHGLYEVEIDGETRVVEYEPDSDLRDSEQVGLLENGGVDAFFKREVLPVSPDSWIASEKTKIGYDIHVERHFKRYQKLRPSPRIARDVISIEHDARQIIQSITAFLDEGLVMEEVAE